jgi:hypothetical protein
VIGSEAERNLLGALIEEPEQYRMVEGLVTAEDFSDPRQAAIFEGIAAMSAQGETVAVESVVTALPEWGTRGITAADVWSWVGVHVLAYEAPIYARAVRDAALRREGEAMARDLMAGVRDGGRDPAQVYSDVRTRLDEKLDGTTGKMAKIATMEEVLLKDDTYDWVVPGMLERKDRLILTGGEGAGKTTFVRQIAVMAAAGLHPLEHGKRIDPLRVLIVDAENTERQWARAVRGTVNLGRRYARGIDPAKSIWLSAGRRIDITNGTELAAVHRLIDEHKPDLLFIGPLYKLVPRAIMTDDDATPLIVALDGLRERGVALVMEAHAGKSTGPGGERDLAPRGSSALMGWPEFGMGIRRLESDPTFAKVVRWRGDRDGRDWPVHLRQGVEGEFPWVPATTEESRAL